MPQLRTRRCAVPGQSKEVGVSGEVEVDETFIGGKARNMHKSAKLRKFGERPMTGTVGKALVMGLPERHGR
ncbi:MAG: transposase, partial [Chloroflexota bacterium]|nr:transposase [Chloroflexota bacterium]